MMKIDLGVISSPSGQYWQNMWNYQDLLLQLTATSGENSENKWIPFVPSAQFDSLM